MSRYFAGAPHQPRARRASDAMVVAIGTLVFLWALSSADRLLALETAITDLLTSVPEWFDQVYSFVFFSALLWIVFLLILAGVKGKARLDVVRDMGLALAIALVVILFTHQRLYGELPAILPEFGDGLSRFPTVRLVFVSAVAAVTAPSLAKPMAKLGWWIVGLTTIATIGLEYAPLGDAIGAMGLGVGAAGVVLLIFGSPGGYPTYDELMRDLKDVGLDVSDLSLTAHQNWDGRTLDARTTDGTEVRVKALGRDAADSQLLNRMWRSIWYRDEPRSHGFGRRERVEHEALSTLIARRNGVGTMDVLAVGIVGEDTAVLVTTAPSSMVDLNDTDDLAAAWSMVGTLHEAEIAHGNLTAHALGKEDEGAILLDFASANLHATERLRHIDVASLLFSTAVDLGAEASVAAAVNGLGSEKVIAALPYVQVPALSHAQKQTVKHPKLILREIAAAVVDQTGTEPVAPERLRRVRPGDLVKPVLSLIAAYALIGMLGQIDFVAVWDVVRNATWILIILGFFIGQFVFVPEATGMRYATGYDIVLRPLVVLQVSVKWIGLAIPSAAGRVAMNAAFLRKYGVPTTTAVSQGAIDGISGFFVEATILLLALLSADLSIDTDLDELRWGLIITIVLFLCFGIGYAIFRIQRLRDAVVPVLKDAWDLLMGVVKTPSRIIGLLLSNLASRIVLAIVLWFVLQAIGTPLPFVTCLVATVATNLLAGLVPVPGGIGIAEAVMTTFLVFFGVDPDSAFAAAVVFRVCTFYIPAGEGFFAMQWLDREGYI
ncbi:MAG: flippase-like domain-containing protein [Acidimicrobiia bacterium]